jgi:hypothetical protein
VHVETPPVPREEKCDANIFHAHNIKQAQVKADVNIEQDIKPQTNHVKPMCARRFAKKASKQSWIFSEIRR